MKTYLLTLIMLLIAGTALAKPEIYVLYHSDTGYIVGSGRIDREESEKKDGSTVSEYIEQKINEGLAVVYLSGFPNPKKHKIIDGKLVRLTAQDKIDIEAARPKTHLELLEERILELEKK